MKFNQSTPESDLEKIKDIYSDLLFEMGLEDIIGHLNTLTHWYISQRDPNDKESFLLLPDHIDQSLFYTNLLQKFILKLDGALKSKTQSL